MRQVEQLELPLWEILQEAAIAPDEANLQQLLDVLDESLLNLDTVAQLQVGAEAIAQIVEVFQGRSTLAFEELESTSSDAGPTMPTDAFDHYVRQTMEVDFDQFIEPFEKLPRKISERSGGIGNESGSVVGELDQTALLQALDAQMRQHPAWTEAEAFNQTMGIAHDEDVSTWVGKISQCLHECQMTAIPLVQLQHRVELPFVQLWLALLLGGFAIEQRGTFYETEQIWVVGA